MTVPRRARVVVVGGGFAGVACARELLRSPARPEVVLFALDNHMVFQPLLPDVAGSSLNPRAVAPPLRALLPGARIRCERIERVDLQERRVLWHDDDGQPRALDYDHVVVACGSVVNMGMLPGLASHSLPIKTIGDAIAIRARVMQQLERADAAESADERRFLLSFVVVGGGFSGVEVAGEINDLVRSCIGRFPGIGRDEARVNLLQGLPDILPEVGEPLRRYARSRMERRGVVVRCNARATEVTARGVLLADGERVAGATVICTIGVAPNPLLSSLDARMERGRLVVRPDLRIDGRPDAWAIGDCALVPNSEDGGIAPPTAQFAEREGRHCARNIARALAGEPMQPFAYRPLGLACGIGGRDGVAELFGLRFSGFPAWWLWRSAFLAKIPSLAQKLKVGIDWAWELVFPRDLSHFRTSRTDPVSTAHLAEGDVLLDGDARRHGVVVIERGRAIALRVDADGSTEVLLEFGPGDLIGDATLADLGGDAVSIVAATPLDASIIASDVLGHLSRSLRPLQGVVERGVRRPGRMIWRHHPAAMRALEGRGVRDMARARNVPALARDTPLGDAWRALAGTPDGCALVVDAGRLAGIATRADLLAALSGGADRSTPLERAMNAHPTTIRDTSPAVAAAELMAVQRLQLLPLVDASGAPSGLLTADDFVGLALSLPR